MGKLLVTQHPSQRGSRARSCQRLLKSADRWVQLLERAGAHERAHGDRERLKSARTLTESELQTGTGKALSCSF